MEVTLALFYRKVDYLPGLGRLYKHVADILSCLFESFQIHADEDNSMVAEGNPYVILKRSILQSGMTNDFVTFLVLRLIIPYCVLI